MIQHSLTTRIRLELLRRLKYFVFMASSGRRAKNVITTAKQKGNPLVITVAFNDPSLVKVQIETLNEFSEHPIMIVVADNSTSKTASEKIKMHAQKLGCGYVRLPWNWYSNSRGAAKPGRGSLSHSVALDWVWKRVATKVEAPLVLFLDHDVFPMVPFSLKKLAGDYIATGPSRTGVDRWTIWPGLILFNYFLLPTKKLTFMPSGDLDSGAGLWSSLFAKIPKISVRFMDREFIQVNEAEDRAKSEIEIIDGIWLHLVDGSGWFDGKGKATELIGREHLGKTLPEGVQHIIGRLSTELADYPQTM